MSERRGRSSPVTAPAEASAFPSPDQASAVLNVANRRDHARSDWVAL